jgi:tyrosyl-tRNA synthetase
VGGKELGEIEKRLKAGENPKVLKMELAHLIVRLYKGEKAAVDAEAHFKTVHEKKEVPDEVEEVKLKGTTWGMIDLIVELGLAPTTSEARRLIQGGAVKWEGEKVADVKASVELTKVGALLQVGKRNFRRVRG